ncbi:amino acid efflux protein [Bordetella hinzii]|uniref:LysE family translocator n=1 Tax=Bordetella hinzii TaxID=103855 RepID=UPI000402DA8B|nr:LysE family translocator [Bordetella hinzii]AKQ55386.1 Homoserine/homoserine lactone efflux protein [Bordetella hinzii]KCB31548.1 translocator protein, LysE family [Bordetella hinzii L60]SNV90917.1 amino acid efflux protein [Bordetella hinzii]
MLSFSLLSLYIGALLMVYALPGPDMALMLQTSAARGVRAGLATAAGLAMARAAHVTLSACGLAVLLKNAPWLYHAVRLAGAAYLLWIAIQVFRSPPFRLDAPQGLAPGALRASMLRGFMGSMLNPKALLFCSVFLPQFLRPGPVAPQMMVLGAILVVFGLLVDLALALGAARLGRWLRGHPRAQAVQRWAFSSVLAAFALRLSLD